MRSPRALRRSDDGDMLTRSKCGVAALQISRDLSEVGSAMRLGWARRWCASLCVIIARSPLVFSFSLSLWSSLELSPLSIERPTKSFTAALFFSPLLTHDVEACALEAAAESPRSHHRPPACTAESLQDKYQLGSRARCSRTLSSDCITSSHQLHDE